MNIETKTFTLAYSQLEDILVAHLYAIGALGDNQDVVSLDMEIPVNAQGQIEFDLDIVSQSRGVNARKNIQIAVDNTILS